LPTKLNLIGFERSAISSGAVRAPFLSLMNAEPTRAVDAAAAELPQLPAASLRHFLVKRQMAIGSGVEWSEDV